MGIPIPKTLVIWASPVTLIQIATVILQGDAHITRVLGMGMPKTGECPYLCDNAIVIEGLQHVYPTDVHQTVACVSQN